MPSSKPEIVFRQFSRGRWSAMVRTETGPIMAVGPSQSEAKRQLDDVIMARAALKFTNECAKSDQRPQGR